MPTPQEIKLEGCSFQTFADAWVKAKTLHVIDLCGQTFTGPYEPPPDQDSQQSSIADDSGPIRLCLSGTWVVVRNGTLVLPQRVQLVVPGKATGTRFENVTIQGPGAAGSARDPSLGTSFFQGGWSPSSLLRVEGPINQHGCTLELKQVTIKGVSSAYCAALHITQGVSVRCRDCTIKCEHEQSIGILADGGSMRSPTELVAASCSVEGPARHVVCAGGGMFGREVAVKLKDCKLKNSQGHLVEIWSGTEATFEGCELTGSKAGCGIRVAGSWDPPPQSEEDKQAGKEPDSPAMTWLDLSKCAITDTEQWSLMASECRLTGSGTKMSNTRADHNVRLSFKYTGTSFNHMNDLRMDKGLYSDAEVQKEYSEVLSQLAKLEKSYQAQTTRHQMEEARLLGAGADLRVAMAAGGAPMPADVAALKPGAVVEKLVVITHMPSEAQEQATALRRALEARGLVVVLSGETASAGLVHAAGVVVVLASKSFGAEPVTQAALNAVKRSARCTLYVVKLVRRVDEQGVEAVLGTLQGCGWNMEQSAEPPARAVDEIAGLMEVSQARLFEWQAPTDKPPRRPILVSFRVLEARPRAVALKREFEALGFPTFCSEVDIPQGADWVKWICSALEQCCVVVVLATETYGSKGTDIFATMEELLFAKKFNKCMYVVRVSPEVAEKQAEDILKGIARGMSWPRGVPDDEPPAQLLKDVVKLTRRQCTADVKKALHRHINSGRPKAKQAVSVRVYLSCAALEGEEKAAALKQGLAELGCTDVFCPALDVGEEEVNWPAAATAALLTSEPIVLVALMTHSYGIRYRDTFNTYDEYQFACERPTLLGGMAYTHTCTVQVGNVPDSQKHDLYSMCTPKMNMAWPVDKEVGEAAKLVAIKVAAAVQEVKAKREATLKDLVAKGYKPA